MKIRIITHHSVLNHGALLQLFALKQVLNKYDSTVCALDYSKNFDFLDETANVKYNFSLKSIPFYFRYLLEKGFCRTLFNFCKKRTLDRYRSDNCLVGEYYSRCKNLDAVFIGSDEVFSIEPGLNPFFWGMGVPSKYVFAYAGCFGPTSLDFIESKNAIEYIKAGINRFSRISVRDANSYGIIKTLSGTEPDLVCDPVILYGYQTEKKEFKRPISSQYILIYSYDNSMNKSDEISKILDFARLNKLKVFSVGFYHQWCDKCINVNPIELLSWINFAEIVITDTFHGTVSALIMNTPFITKIRGNRNKLGYLLDEYNVRNRETIDFSNLQILYQKQIDFNSVNKLIEAKREIGLNYIKSCLETVK